MKFFKLLKEYREKNNTNDSICSSEKNVAQSVQAAAEPRPTG